MGSAIDKKENFGVLLQYEIMCNLFIGRIESYMALSTAEAKDVATCYLGERSSEAPICDPD